MIKRRSNLSIEEGGSVSREGKNGQCKRLGTYCRLFQTRPTHSKSMLCVGFLGFPPCPDYPTCAVKPRKPKRSGEVAAQEATDDEDEG